jgi:dipeptidase E
MRQIIAMGGGGFTMELGNPLLDLFVLKQCASRKPKVCFLATASGDAQTYIDRFYAAFGTFACTPSHLSLFTPPTADLRSFILDHDVLYVGGGNTKSMLALWREWKLDAIIRDAYLGGMVLAGLSAGSICWFEEGLTDSIPGPLTAMRCLGLLRGSNCPHYDGEPERRPAYHRLVAAGELSSGIAADDSVALHYIDESLHAIVSSKANVRAYRVDRTGDEAVETPVPATQLS